MNYFVYLMQGGHGGGNTTMSGSSYGSNFNTNFGNRNNETSSRTGLLSSPGKFAAKQFQNNFDERRPEQKTLLRDPSERNEPEARPRKVSR